MSSGGPDAWAVGASTSTRAAASAARVTGPRVTSPTLPQECRRLNHLDTIAPVAAGPVDAATEGPPGRARGLPSMSDDRRGRRLDAVSGGPRPSRGGDRAGPGD